MWVSIQHALQFRSEKGQRLQTAYKEHWSWQRIQTIDTNTQRITRFVEEMSSAFLCTVQFKERSMWDF